MNEKIKIENIEKKIKKFIHWKGDFLAFKVGANNSTKVR